MLNFIKTALAELLEKFKARNPQMWFALFLFFLTLQIGLEPALTLLGLNVAIGLPPEFLSLDWIIATLGWHVNDTLTDAILQILASLTGAKTALYLKPANSEKVIKGLVMKSNLDLDELAAEKRSAKK